MVAFFVRGQASHVWHPPIGTMAIPHPRSPQVALFKVMLHGTGIRIPALDGDGDVVGFHRVQKVRAPTGATAESIALNAVRDEWASGRRASHDVVPVLEVEQVTEVSLMQYLTHKNGAHLFYPDEH